MDWLEAIKNMPDEKPSPEEYEGYILWMKTNNPMFDKETAKLKGMNSKKLDIPVDRSHPDYMKYYVKIRKEEVANHKKDWAEKNKERKRQQWREWKKIQKDLTED